MGTKGYKFTLEQRARMSAAHMGHVGYWTGKKKSPLSQETKNKISQAQKGEKSSMYGKKHSEATKLKISISHKGKNTWSKGRKLSQEHVKNTLAGTKRYYDKNGRKCKLAILIRGSKEYKLWRKAVFERDDYTCQSCKKRGNGILNAHHIKPFALFPELRLAIDNGSTLCEPCHKNTDSYLKRPKTRAALNGDFSIA